VDDKDGDCFYEYLLCACKSMWVNVCMYIRKYCMYVCTYYMYVRMSACMYVYPGQSETHKFKSTQSIRVNVFLFLHVCLAHVLIALFCKHMNAAYILAYIRTYNTYKEWEKIDVFQPNLSEHTLAINAYTHTYIHTYA
jgi:hypothetical protein